MHHQSNPTSLEGVYMVSFWPKRGGNESLTSIKIRQSVYMVPGVSAEPTSPVLVPEALPFVSAASAMLTLTSSQVELLAKDLKNIA